MSTVATATAFKFETFCARPTVTTKYGDPRLDADEASWIAVLDANGEPIMDREVFTEDTGVTNVYQQDATPPDGLYDWSEIPGFGDAVASLRAEMAEADRETWAEWLADNKLRVYRVYPRDFANEYDLVVLSEGEPATGRDAHLLKPETAAEILAGQYGEWYGGITWPTL